MLRELIFIAAVIPGASSAQPVQAILQRAVVYEDSIYIDEAAPSMEPNSGLGGTSVSVEDREGNVFKGRTFYFGPHLYFEFNDYLGHPQIIELGRVDEGYIQNDDPEDRAAILRFLPWVKYRPVFGGVHFRFELTMPSGKDHPHSLPIWKRIDTQRSAIDQLEGFSGTFVLDPDSISGQWVTPLEINYLEFSKLSVERVFRESGHWYLRFTTNRTRFFSQPTNSDWFKTIDFKVDIADEGSISLVARRHAIFRAPLLTISNVRPGAINFWVRAEKRFPFSSINAHQMAMFCKLATIDLGRR